MISLPKKNLPRDAPPPRTLENVPRKTTPSKWTIQIAYDYSLSLLKSDDEDRVYGSDRIRTDITDITSVFIFQSGFGFEYG